MTPAAAPLVWVTRPRPGNEATVAALEGAGYRTVAAPLLETRFVVPTPPVTGPWPDWVVFVSANAVRAFDASLGEPGFPPEERVESRAAVVGRRTAEAARAAGWRVELVPESNQTAEGLLELLSGRELDGRTVWIPTGSREGSATRTLPEGLRTAGASVRTFQVYETADRRLPSGDLERLGAGEPGAAIFHSPSAVDALFSPPDHVFPRKAGDLARAWREEAAAVAIGPVTARRLRDHGAVRVETCDTPSDEDLLRTLERIPRLRGERSPS